jgi:hypothetical protein
MQWPPRARNPGDSWGIVAPDSRNLEDCRRFDAPTPRCNRAWRDAMGRKGLCQALPGVNVTRAPERGERGVGESRAPEREGARHGRYFHGCMVVNHEASWIGADGAGGVLFRCTAHLAYAERAPPMAPLSPPPRHPTPHPGASRKEPRPSPIVTAPDTARLGTRLLPTVVPVPGPYSVGPEPLWEPVPCFGVVPSMGTAAIMLNHRFPSLHRWNREPRSLRRSTGWSRP